MGFKLPPEFEEKRQRIYNMKYITYGDKEIHVSELEDRSVTSAMKEQMRMNSYALDDLPPKLTNEALALTAELYLSHISKPRLPCASYDEALAHKLVPEMIKRLREME